MNGEKIKQKIISAFIICVMVSTGLFGLLIFAPEEQIKVAAKINMPGW